MNYDDAHIDHWGRVYRGSTALPCAMRFDTFLTQPQRHVALFHDHRELPAGDFLPLLPRQIAVQQRLDAAERKTA